MRCSVVIAGACGRVLYAREKSFQLSWAALARSDRYPGLFSNSIRLSSHRTNPVVFRGNIFFSHFYIVFYLLLVSSPSKNTITSSQTLDCLPPEFSSSIERTISLLYCSMETISLRKIISPF